MSKEKKNKKSFEKRLQKFDKAYENTEAMDVGSKSNKYLETLLIWLIAIGVGVFITVFSNMDKLQIDNKIPEKIILIISLSIIGLSLLMLSILRLLLFLRDYAINTSKNIILKIRHKIENGTIEKSDEDKLDRRIKAWIKMINVPGELTFLKYGIILMFLGVFVFVGYFIYFLIIYK